MKLSEAMQKGCELLNVPQITGRLFDFDDNGNICGACALGFALYTVKDKYPKLPFKKTISNVDWELYYKVLREEFPLLVEDGNNGGIYLFDITDMNDWRGEALDCIIEQVEAKERE